MLGELGSQLYFDVLKGRLSWFSPMSETQLSFLCHVRTQGKEFSIKHKEGFHQETGNTGLMILEPYP